MIPEELQVPGYDINERIGRGGMASVYRARQHTFDRDVALKVLKPDLSEDESFCQRFVQESLIVAKLHHSHIVQVYDVGEFQNNFYIAMEYLHGGDLNTRLKKGITINETVEVIKQAASALDFAHKKGIIHRDIKPDNIMFREDGAAVLTDFGIAKEIDSDLNLTQTGLIVGTPKYMSPEQIRGDAAGPKADIYALGILFFQCLTNHVPFDGKDMVATAYKHFNEPVPELPPIVAAFQPIVEKMLAKQPEDRYARAKDIIADIDKLYERQAMSSVTNLEMTEVFVPPPSSLDPTIVHGETVASGNDETALTQVPERFTSQNADNSGNTQESKSSKLPVWLSVSAGIAVIIVGAVVLLFLPNPSTNSVQVDPIENSPQPVVSQSSNQNSITVQRLLEEAKQDIQQKRLTKPDSNNAFNKFERVLGIDPNNAEALAGMQQIAEEYVKLADRAILARKFNQAQSDLDLARTAAPTLGLIDVIEAKLQSATQAKLDKQASITLMQKSLVIQGLLESAAINIEDGQIRSPADDNALEKYQRVLELDPDNLEAKLQLKKYKN